MIATDGIPTIANAHPLRVTSRTHNNGTQEYIIKDYAGNVVSEGFSSFILANEALRVMRDAVKGK